MSWHQTIMQLCDDMGVTCSGMLIVKHIVTATVMALTISACNPGVRSGVSACQDCVCVISTEQRLADVTSPHDMCSLLNAHFTSYNDVDYRLHH